MPQLARIQQWFFLHNKVEDIVASGIQNCSVVSNDVKHPSEFDSCLDTFRIPPIDLTYVWLPHPLSSSISLLPRAYSLPPRPHKQTNGKVSQKPQTVYRKGF